MNPMNKSNALRPELKSSLSEVSLVPPKGTEEIQSIGRIVPIEIKSNESRWGRFRTSIKEFFHRNVIRRTMTVEAAQISRANAVNRQLGTFLSQLSIGRANTYDFERLIEFAKEEASHAMPHDPDAYILVITAAFREQWRYSEDRNVRNEQAGRLLAALVHNKTERIMEGKNKNSQPVRDVLSALYQCAHTEISKLHIKKGKLLQANAQINSVLVNNVMVSDDTSFNVHSTPEKEVKNAFLDLFKSMAVKRNSQSLLEDLRTTIDLLHRNKDPGVSDKELESVFENLTEAERKEFQHFIGNRHVVEKVNSMKSEDQKHQDVYEKILFVMEKFKPDLTDYAQLKEASINLLESVSLNLKIHQSLMSVQEKAGIQTGDKGISSQQEKICLNRIKKACTDQDRISWISTVDKLTHSDMIKKLAFAQDDNNLTEDIDKKTKDVLFAIIEGVVQCGKILNLHHQKFPLLEKLVAKDNKV